MHYPKKLDLVHQTVSPHERVGSGDKTKDNLESQISESCVMSSCSQDSQTVCAKLLSLPDNAKKTQFLVPQLK